MGLKSQTNLTNLSSEVAVYLQPQLANLFLSLSSASGWPEHLVDSIKVIVHEDFTVELSYPEANKKAIELLEYGNLDTIPNAVIRPFLRRSERFIEETLNEVALGTMVELAVGEAL